MERRIHAGIAERSKSRGIRLGNILLMMIFTISAFAIAGAAAGCFTELSESFGSSENGMAAAQFIVNRIHSVGGQVEIRKDDDGKVSGIVINDGDYADILYINNEGLCEDYVRKSEADSISYSSADCIFRVKGLLTEVEKNGLIRITVIAENGSSYTAYAACDV